MILTGHTLRIARDLTPAQIIAPEHAASGDPAVLAAHCLETVDASFADNVREGDLLVVDGRLHDGAGVESAVLALQALGIAAVICAAADAAFMRWANDYGLAFVVQPTAAAALGERKLVRVDLDRGAVEVQRNSRWSFAPPSLKVVAAVQRTQLLARMRRVVEDEGSAE